MNHLNELSEATQARCDLAPIGRHRAPSPDGSHTQEEEETAVTGEIDRLYMGAPSETYIIDGERAIKVLKMGFADAVVWNIGEAKSAEMKVGVYM